MKHSDRERGPGAVIVEISCSEVWQELSEFVDGTLDPALRQRLELHLAHCKHCRAIYDGARNVVQLIGDEEVFDLPSGFSDRLFARLNSEFCHGGVQPGS